MKNIYEINKNIEKIKRGSYTNFLSPNIFQEIKYKLKKDEYKIYLVYPDSEKVILYKNKIPEVKLLSIISKNKLRHQDILGSLFALGVSDDSFGDIIIKDNEYYIYLIPEILNFVQTNLLTIGNYKVDLEEIDINTLSDYKREYETSNIITSSLRIDTVIARIIGTSRDKVIDKIKDKEILLNSQTLTNNSYKLREKDTFSIRKFGKYQFIKVLKNTKKDNYLIEYNKYI